MSESKAVVIDNGTGLCKAGFSGEEAPTVSFPACIGRPKYGALLGADTQDYYVGHEAAKKKGLLNIKYPVAHGKIEDWDDMTKIWNHCYYNELRVDPTEQPVHLTEAPKNPRANREQMMQIFFEEFSVPAFYISIQAVLSLYSSGKVNGLIYDSGDGVTHTVPVYESYSMKHAINRMDLAGRDLTFWMRDILCEAGTNFSSTGELEIVKEIKEKKCYVALDYEEELKTFEESKAKDTEFELPDGTVLTFGSQQIRCPEAIFQPSFLGMDIAPAHQTIYDSVQKCDVDLRRELFGSITLSGGSTMFPGIEDRITKEVAALAPASVAVKVSASPDRKFSVWIGGSILSDLATFQNMWVTRQEFDEAGASIVHRKCF